MVKKQLSEKEIKKALILETGMVGEILPVTEQDRQPQEVQETVAREPRLPHQRQPNPLQAMIVVVEAAAIPMTVRKILGEAVPGVAENEKTSCYIIVVCRDWIWADSK